LQGFKKTTEQSESMYISLVLPQVLPGHRNKRSKGGATWHN